ncbi:MAG: tetratricopeptide repeat protein, partial [Deltaproteobacteria bacterium]|nr:tetratricopeptide repeat protein [Deltaproteobacteria bacterium]
SPDELEALAKNYERDGNLDNAEQTFERLRMLVEHPAQKAGYLLRLGNLQAALGECDAAKRSLARYMREAPEEASYARFLSRAIAECDAARPPAPERVAGKDGTGVGVGPVAVRSGTVDAEAVTRTLERIAPRFRACVESARRGGLRIDHVGLDVDVKADGSLVPNSYEDTDDAELVRCLGTNFPSLQLPKSAPGRVQLTLWFDD